MASVLNIFRDPSTLSAEYKGSAAALGNFDGVHPGHVAVINRALAKASESGVKSSVIAFEPHPRQFFRPYDPNFRLSSLHAKGRVLSSLGVDTLFALNFDAELAAMLAEDFVSDIIVGQLALSHLVVGADFQFGKGRGGNTDLLCQMGSDLGFTVDVVDMVDGEGPELGTFSSTQVRGALRKGNAGQAEAALGRLWSIDGIVEKGDQRGRTIGFPTLNVPTGQYLHPKLGVYAVMIEVLSGEQAGLYPGVANLGNRPTFNKEDTLLEAHLFDFEGDLYGAHVYVYFADFIRPEQKFEGLDALKAQISADEVQARHFWAQNPAPNLIKG